MVVLGRMVVSVCVDSLGTVVDVFSTLLINCDECGFNAICVAVMTSDVNGTVLEVECIDETIADWNTVAVAFVLVTSAGEVFSRFSIEYETDSMVVNKFFEF